MKNAASSVPRFIGICLLLAGLAVSFVACDRADLPEIFDQTNHYPNTLHSFWVYERYDSLENAQDRVTVTVVGDTLVAGTTLKIWEYEYEDFTEKRYVVQEGDSLKIFESQLDRIDQVYILPLEIDLGWVNPDYRPDTSFVLSRESVSVNGSEYARVYVVERNAICCNTYLFEKIWIKPGLGVIQLVRKATPWGGPRRDEVWTLVDYKIE